MSTNEPQNDIKKRRIFCRWQKVDIDSEEKSLNEATWHIFSFSNMEYF